jgi:hydrogenase expression/formation protein HypC
MCLALPARILELTGPETARVELGAVCKTISVALVPEARVGDYVIVHVGHAIGVLDEAEARATLALFAEMAQHPANDHPPSEAATGGS